MPFEQQQYAYIDECGNPDLEIEKAGASPLFVCVAVLVDDSEQGALENGADEVSRAHFSGSPLKSSNVGRDDARRLRILKDLCAVEFRYYALIVDKAAIKRDSGLQWRRTFYKYLNRMLYTRIAQGCAELRIHADRLGGQDFMTSFQAYMKAHQLPDLLSDIHPIFVNSRECQGVQVADFVAGTLTRCFDPTGPSPNASRMRDLLRKHEIGIRSWPVLWQQGAQADDEMRTDWDADIRNAAMYWIQRLEEQYDDDPNEDRQSQLHVARHLLYLRAHGDGDRTITATQLIQYLARNGLPEYSSQAFHAKVIGPLRDAGIVIAGSHDGYRLAMNYDDVRRYVEHGSIVIEPMMARLERAREQIKFATSNRLDILGEDSFLRLKALADRFSDYNAEGIPQ